MHNSFASRSAPAAGAPPARAVDQAHPLSREKVRREATAQAIRRDRGHGKVAARPALRERLAYGARRALYHVAEVGEGDVYSAVPIRPTYELEQHVAGGACPSCVLHDGERE